MEPRKVPRRPLAFICRNPLLRDCNYPPTSPPPSQCSPISHFLKLSTGWEQIGGTKWGILIPIRRDIIHIYLLFTFSHTVFPQFSNDKVCCSWRNQGMRTFSFCWLLHCTRGFDSLSTRSLIPLTPNVRQVSLRGLYARFFTCALSYVNY